MKLLLIHFDDFFCNWNVILFFVYFPSGISCNDQNERFMVFTLSWPYFL